MTQRGVAILGSTGSVGTTALRVLARQREAFVVRALTAFGNAELLQLQAAWNGAVDTAVTNGFVLAADEPKLKLLPEPGLTMSVVVGVLALGAFRRRPVAARN